MNWNHTSLGRFDISEQWIGLDFRQLFLDPVRADATLFHEVTHSLIGRTTEMGQATQNIFFFIKGFKHLNADQREGIMRLLVNSQKFVQEGFATFMEMQRLRQRTSWAQALGEKEHLHPEYLERFEKMEFVFDMTHKQRERFTKKISNLVMETEFRRNAPRLDLLRSPENLENYLNDPAHNPTARLEKVLAALKTNDRILIKKPRKIAKMCGISFFEPATRQEVCGFVNYLLTLAGEKPEYTIDLVGKTIPIDAMTESMDSVLVSNMNLQLAETAEMLWKQGDINFEASHAHVVFAVYHTRTEESDFLEPHIGRKFEVALIMFRGTGEKYLAVTSQSHAESLLANELKNATLITKWGICDPVNGTFSITTKRKPDIIMYNRPADMLATFQAAGKNIKNYEHLHLGAMEAHPYQSLIVKTNKHDVIHYVNGFGNAGISKVIQFIKPKSKALKPGELEKHARQINDTLAIMGLPWNVDWVRTIIAQDKIIYR